MYLVSSCLLGVKCRYNGTGAANKKLIELDKDGLVIRVCPEVLGGLPIPRDPCEIVIINGEQHIVNKDGEDYTNEYLDGANKALEICLKNNITKAILKSKSPSCGCGMIYDGSFTGKLIEGDGLTAKLFKEHGIDVMSDVEWSK